MSDEIEIPATPYLYHHTIDQQLKDIADRVAKLRQHGPLSHSDSLVNLRKYFKLKQIYHSNAIEGNKLDIGETRLVVEQGLTITGKSLKDQAEARNLSEALDYLESLAKNADEAIKETDIRQIHGFVLKGIDLENAGGYRKVIVKISGSAYIPPDPIDVPIQMAEYSNWIKTVSVPSGKFASKEGVLVATVAHAWLVYIHPFVDGNGRVARLIMNLLLMRYGFPIAIILKEDRMRYYDALEESQSGNLTPLIQLLFECLGESIEEYEQALAEYLVTVEWTQRITRKLSEKEMIKSSNDYVVWMKAMELFMGIFTKHISGINDNLVTGNRIYLKEFGMLDYEKYYSLRNHGSAKRTWFFRVDFKINDRAVRYLFFFGAASQQVKSNSCDVSIFVAKEDPVNSFNYVRLDNTKAFDVPSIREIGYDFQDEGYVYRTVHHVKRKLKADEIAKLFLEEVCRHFSD
jgi:Fic family protein